MTKIDLSNEKKKLSKLLGAVTLLVLLSSLVSGQQQVPTKIKIDGIEMAYIEKGVGEPLILLHGGQGDYRSWGPQMELLSKKYRVISYSRRYNYPNENPVDPKYKPGYSEADDLKKFVDYLGIKRVHLVGTSIGATTALIFSIQNPRMVITLAVAEPPIHAWARNDDRGRLLYDNFLRTIWHPAAIAFRNSDETGAMRFLVDGFGGPGTFDAMPAKGRETAIQNARFFKMATAAADPFPALSKKKVANIKMPILIIEGAHTIELHQFDNNELARLLPKARRVTIPDAGHGSARENPAAFNAAVTEFLARQRP